MTKPTAAEMQAYVAKRLNYRRNTIGACWSSGAAIPSEWLLEEACCEALLDFLDESQPATDEEDGCVSAGKAALPAAGKVSREKKRAELMACIRECEREGVYSGTLRAIFADYAQPVLPEGWSLEQGPGKLDAKSRLLCLKSNSYGEIAWQWIARGRVSINGSLPINPLAARAWHLACADAIAQAIEEESGGDD